MILEEKIQNIISATIEDLGYEIVRVKYFSGNTTLQIMIDKLDGQSINVEDCAKVSNAISVLLDIEDPINEKYNLEISSPGIDRPLVRLNDFIKYKGNKARFILKHPLENMKKFKGVITDVKENCILLQLDTGAEFKIDYSNIDSANLLISDSLFK